MRIVLGIDPDLHTTGMAVVRSDMKLLAVAVARVPSQIKGEVAVVKMSEVCNFFIEHMVAEHHITTIVVEGQEIYLGKTRNPKSILQLAQVAGSCLGRTGCCSIIPEPKQWKGSIPKYIAQGRFLERVGIQDYEVCGSGSSRYCRPAQEEVSDVFFHGEIKGSDWKHISDAVGLGVWGAVKVF